MFWIYRQAWLAWRKNPSAIKFDWSELGLWEAWTENGPFFDYFEFQLSRDPWMKNWRHFRSHWLQSQYLNSIFWITAIFTESVFRNEKLAWDDRNDIKQRMSGSDFPITEAIKRQQEQQAAVRERRRTRWVSLHLAWNCIRNLLKIHLCFRHNSLSPINQDRFERRFSEIDKNNDGLIDQREIQKELQASQTNIPYKEIRQINTVGSSSFKDGMFIRWVIF